MTAQAAEWAGADTIFCVPAIEGVGAIGEHVETNVRVHRQIVLLRVLRPQLQPRVAWQHASAITETCWIGWLAIVSGVVDDRARQFRVVRP